MLAFSEHLRRRAIGCRLDMADDAQALTVLAPQSRGAAINTLCLVSFLLAEILLPETLGRSHGSACKREWLRLVLVLGDLIGDPHAALLLVALEPLDCSGGFALDFLVGLVVNMAHVS